MIHTLLDKWLPHYTYREVHETKIPRTVAEIYPLTRHLDFNESVITRILFRIRGMPSHDLSLDTLLQKGFQMLEEDPPREFVVGLIAEKGRITNMKDSEHFQSFRPRQGLRIAWNFYLKQVDAASVLVTTETRVLCFGRRTRIIFALYWITIRPFSGIIRREMLRIIRKQVSRRRVSSPGSKPSSP